MNQQEELTRLLGAMHKPDVDIGISREREIARLIAELLPVGFNAIDGECEVVTPAPRALESKDDNV